MKQGERVGAISGTKGDEKVVHIFGFGVYEGETVPTSDAGGFMGKMLHDGKVKNPTIKLDNGDIVYGCECWWGAEEQIKAKIAHFEEGGYKIVTITIADARAGAEEPAKQ